MKTILFDLDGTLVDSCEGITLCTQYALRAFGIEETDLEKLKCFIGPPLADSFQKYYNFTKEDATAAVAKYRERYNPTGIFECSLYPDVEEVLRRLKRAGYRIAMASSKPEVSCRKIMEHFGLFQYFDEIAGASYDGKRDSKIQVLKEVITRMKLTDMSEVILVGDTVYDVIGAREAGIRCLAVSYGFGSCDKMRAEGAVAVCDSMKEVGDYLVERF